MPTTVGHIDFERRPAVAPVDDVRVGGASLATVCVIPPPADARICRRADVRVNRWHPRLVLSDSDRRDLLEQVVSDVAHDGVEVEWLTSKGWSAHARLQGASGLVGYLLTSPEWQEARFTEPRRSTFLIADGSDREDVQKALERLARAVVAYISGNHNVEHKRGLLGTRTTLVLDTSDGLWRLGKRTTQPPTSARACLPIDVASGYRRGARLRLGT